MSRLRIPAVEDPDFVVDVQHGGDVSVIKMVGNADAAATGPLGALLEVVHREVMDRARREVVVDLRALEALSAACLRHLMAWIERVRTVALPARYRLRFRVNPAIAWQESSLRSLACFDTDLVTIEVA